MKAKKQGPREGRPDRQFSLETLATESDIPGRTIRYYITRGLLEGPVCGGRGAFYTGAHLERLREIRRSQQQGLTLTEIQRIAGTHFTAQLPEPESWWAYQIADDVVVQVKSRTSPWRQRQVKTTLERLARELSLESKRKDTEK